MHFTTRDRDTTISPRIISMPRFDRVYERANLIMWARAEVLAELAGGELDLAIAPALSGTRDLRAEPLWTNHLITLISMDNPIRLPMTLDSFPAAAHVVDADHVQVTADGQEISVVDSILAARGLRRRIAVVLPNSAGIPFVVAATNLVATLPRRITKDLAMIPELRVVPAPLPPVEVSPHLIWRPRTQNSLLRAWLRGMIKGIAAGL